MSVDLLFLNMVLQLKAHQTTQLALYGKLRIPAEKSARSCELLDLTVIQSYLLYSAQHAKGFHGFLRIRGSCSWRLWVIGFLSLKGMA